MARPPSYTYETKNELAHILIDNEKILRTELAAMFGTSLGMVEGRADLINSNAAVMRKVITLTKKIFTDAKLDVAAVRRKFLKKTMKYAVRVFLTAQTEDFFNELYSEEFIERPNLGVAYLRGAFLAGGSVNRPEKANHLEIAFAKEIAAEFTQKIFHVFDINAGYYERKGFFVVYLKEGDAICDFLGIIGAEKAVERFEVARNVKDVRAMVNRIVNCETANVNKAVAAAQRQIADINLILSHKIRIDDELLDTMYARLEYPEDTAEELAAKLYLSKQGFLYRMKIVRELAALIRGDRK